MDHPLLLFLPHSQVIRGERENPRFMPVMQSAVIVRLMVINFLEMKTTEDKPINRHQDQQGVHHPTPGVLPLPNARSEVSRSRDRDPILLDKPRHPQAVMMVTVEDMTGKVP